MVEFSEEAVKGLLEWLRGVAAGVAEEFGLDRYSKKVVFEDFVVSWLLVSAQSGSGLREHVRQFRIAGLSLSPSSVSHRLNKWQKLVPALLKVFRRVVERVRRQARNRFFAPGINHTIGKIAVFDTTWLSFSSSLVAWALQGGGGAEHKTFVKLLVRTRMDAGGAGTVEHIAVRWDSRSFDDNSFLEEASSIGETGVTLLFDEGFNELLKLRKMAEKGNHFVAPYHGYAIRDAEKLELEPEDMEYGVKEDVRCILGAEDNPGRMEARVITATVTCRGGRLRKLKLVTERFNLPARIVLEIYRLRWSIEVLFRLLKRGGFDLEKPSARSPQGMAAHILLVMLAFLLAVLASVACGAGFDMRHPSVLYFKSWLKVRGGALLVGVFSSR